LDKYEDPSRDNVVFDSDKNFIYAVQPFSCNFARILYSTFGRNQNDDNTPENPVIFINDEILAIAEGKDLFLCNTDSFFEDNKNGENNGRDHRKTRYYEPNQSRNDLAQDNSR
jgi:hypothetical protein